MYLTINPYVLLAKVSLDEIRNILKSNLNLYMSIYKDDPDFVDYFIDLTIYLLRYKYDNASEIFDVTPDSDTELPEPEQRVLQTGSLKNPTRPPTEFCHFCGAQLRGHRKCPVCGNIGL